MKKYEIIARCKPNKKSFLKLFMACLIFIALPLLILSGDSSGSLAAVPGNGQTSSIKAETPNAPSVKKLSLDPSGMMVSFDFQNAKIADVIRMIAKVSNMNVLIGSDVKGVVTMKMKDVPLKDVLKVLMEAYGLGMVRKDGIVYINSASTISSVVSAQRKAEALSQPKETKVVPINYVDPSAMIPKLKSSLSPEGTVMFDKSLNALIVTDTESHVNRVVKLIKLLDRQTPEVEIVAKMVEVDKSYTSQLGINWNAGFFHAAPVSSNQAVTPNYFGGETTGNPAGPGLSPSLTTQAAPGTFSLGIINSYASIVGTLQALENLSHAKSIAEPKVVVLNNEKATIEKGETAYIPAVAGVGAVAAPQAITGQLSLNITPHIMDNGDVKLVINSTNNTISPTPLVQGAQATLQTESANSTVIVKNGQTVVIGGVYQMSNSIANNGIPVLMDIPLLGWLFKSRNTTVTKSVLLIFITPEIINS